MLKNTTYALWKKTEGYTNEYGDWVNGSEYVKDVVVDKQPYNKELLLRNYGYNIEVTDRLFYEKFGGDTDIQINYILKNGTEEYEIRQIITWDTYVDIFVYRIK